MIIHMLCLLFVAHYLFWPVGCDNTHAVFVICGALFILAVGL